MLFIGTVSMQFAEDAIVVLRSIVYTISLECTPGCHLGKALKFIMSLSVLDSLKFHDLLLDRIHLLLNPLEQFELGNKIKPNWYS